MRSFSFKKPTFRCNVCGSACQFPLDELARGTKSCKVCRSSPRTRALVDIIARNLVGRSIPLPEFPDRSPVRGLGLTDAKHYASRLAKKFDYRNTYFHQEPHFDIVGEIAPEDLEAYDFVISSEVFEHVVPPVARAFENTFRLLKPGGLLVLTVPYNIKEKTVEHFPDLHDFSVTKQESGDYILTNVTREGVRQTFERLVFHGGPGTTLEMRVFAERDLIGHLVAAGFTDVEIHQESHPQYGILWPERWSRPITARKPLGTA